MRASVEGDPTVENDPTFDAGLTVVDGPTGDHHADGRGATRKPRGLAQHLIIVTILIAIAIGAAIAIRALANVTRDSATGAEPSAAYHDALSAGFPLEGRMRWLDSVDGLKRVPTEATLKRVAGDWAAIWYTIDSLRSGDPVADPRILMSASMVQRIREHQPQFAWETVEQSTHILQVNYYSLDGAIIGLNVEASAVNRFADSVTGAPLEYPQISNYHAVLILTDGRWRLTSLQRVGSAAKST